MTPALLSATIVLVAALAVMPKAACRGIAVAGSPNRSQSAADRRTIRSRWHRRTHVDPGELAVWCDGLARSLRGGSTLHQSLRMVPPPTSVVDALDPAVLALQRGASINAALAMVTSSSPHLDLVLVVLRACAEHGGAPAEPIDRAATALRQRSALIAERRTHSAQARMSAVVMTMLPGAMLAVLLVTSGSVRTAVTSPIGVFVIVLGAFCNACGWVWMRRLIGGLR